MSGMMLRRKLILYLKANREVSYKIMHSKTQIAILKFSKPMHFFYHEMSLTMLLYLRACMGSLQLLLVVCITLVNALLMIFNQINNYSFHHVLLVSIDVFFCISNIPTSFWAIIMGLSLILFHKQTFGMHLSIDITINLLPFSIALAIILWVKV